MYKRTICIGLVVEMCLLVTTLWAGSAVVTNGKFTNIYVYPTSDTETWEQHIAPLRPADADKFSRASIDAFTRVLMQPDWPSYFDPLYQYNSIQPPRFFGSAVATKQCVDAALHDASNGVLQWDTIRSLANCHIAGMDPSPQVNLIFSPDIKIAKIVVGGTGPEMCTTSPTNAWHAWGINTPNFVALPTSIACMSSFDTFTQAMSHEDVETVSDPAGMGMGDFGQNELGDNCENKPDAFTMMSGFSLSRYWSNFDNNCQPRLDPPAGSVSETWVLGESVPLIRFTGSVHTLSLPVPASRTTTDAAVTQALLVIQTGGDDLRGGSSPSDNANATLSFAGGTAITTNINQGRGWGNGETHAVTLTLPANPPPVSAITGVTIATGFGGGLSGDNWNVDKVALIVSFPVGSPTIGTAPPVVHNWLDASGAPLIRFTGSVHDLTQPVSPQDPGLPVTALNLIISTGNDDLRGGSNPGDNCDVTVQLTSGQSIVLTNVNGGSNWANWTSHTVPIPLPASGLHGGDVASVALHTGFGGGISGDNWNVNELVLQATLGQTPSCQSGLTACSQTCVDLNTDSHNCGACGNACSAGQTCTNATCETIKCPSGLTLCSGSCVNLKTDSRDCGACGNACGAGQACNKGTCGCPAGTSLCCRGDLGCRPARQCPKVCP